MEEIKCDDFARTFFFSTPEYVCFLRVKTAMEAAVALGHDIIFLFYFLFMDKVIFRFVLFYLFFPSKVLGLLKGT
jgi:hypothetical protein